MILRTWWQPLSGAWYLSVHNRAEKPMALGRQISAQRRLIEASEFAGDLVVIPLVEDSPSVGREAWGETHALVYFDPSEVEQVEWTL